MAQTKAEKAKERFPVLSLGLDLLANHTVIVLKYVPKLRRQWRCGSAGWHPRHAAELLELWASTSSRRPLDGAEALCFQTVRASEMTTSYLITMAYFISLLPEQLSCLRFNQRVNFWLIMTTAAVLRYCKKSCVQ